MTREGTATVQPNLLFHCANLSMSRDADVLVLVRGGVGWLGGPKTRLRLTTWLIEHTEVSLDDCHRMPEHIRHYVAAVRNAALA